MKHWAFVFFTPPNYGQVQISRTCSLPRGSSGCKIGRSKHVRRTVMMMEPDFSHL